MRVVLIHNPRAGDDERGDDAYRRALERAGHDVVAAISSEDDPRESARTADVVVVAGGDGTVRSAFKALAGIGTAATIFPAGSANNIARSLGIHDDDPVRLAAGLDGGCRRPYDLGVLRAGGEAAVFVESMGGGLFTEVLQRAEPSGEDKIRLGLELLRDTVADAQPAMWDLVIDGTDRSAQLLGVQVMIVREGGPNVPFAPDADPGDGVLDTVLIAPRHRAALAAYVDARLTGESPPPPALDVCRAREVELSAPGPRLHVDDQVVEAPSGSRPRRSIATTGDRLTVLIPQAAG
jgi:diacylglycerol kinase (ATP)